MMETVSETLEPNSMAAHPRRLIKVISASKFELVLQEQRQTPVLCVVILYSMLI
jgi:hypothetical protein